MMKATRVQVEHLTDPLGIDIPHPFVTWCCEGGREQSAYEITATSEGAVVWSTGKVRSSEMCVRFSGHLQSRQAVDLSIVLYDESDVPGEPSHAHFEMAFLEKSCWKGKWISPEEQDLTEVNTRPAGYLRKTFQADEITDARLYITAHGLYAAFLNGQRVSSAVLTPGPSGYHKRLEYQTYDVSSLLRSGENTLDVILGDGWYRGKSGMNNVAGNLFGTDLALLAQLEIDKEPVCVTDASWLASTDGPIRANGLDYGEIVDSTKGDGAFAASGFHTPRILPFGYDILVCGNSVPITEHETFSAEVLRTPNGETVLDFGQNLAGYIRMTVRAKAGQTIRLVHGESLDENGNFTIANIQDPRGGAGRTIRQEVSYTCKDGQQTYCPLFSLFGFRYALLESEIPPEDMEFSSVAVYSDMEETASFHCADTAVDCLFQNSLWSMKSNFAGIPTDCPTRERSGWTGDIGLFADTAVFLMDCYPVLRKWLAELRSEQYPNGKVPNIAPQNEPKTKISRLVDGSAGWGDAIGLVPSALARTYNDTAILQENYDAFKQWVEFSKRRAHRSRLPAILKRDPDRHDLIDTGYHWGEWLEPGVDVVKDIATSLLKGAPEVPTAFYAYSTRLLASAAERLGKREDSNYYLALSERIRNAYRRAFLPNGIISAERQAPYVRPLALGLLSESEKSRAASDLNGKVLQNDCHLNTGFLSTPHLLHVLSENGYTDTAYRLLHQDTLPGWLYSVKTGATTIWENWDGIREDGTVNQSLNHYTYGSVSGWLMSDVAGIRLDFGKIVLAPHPDRSLGQVDATYRSPIGTIRSSWEADEKGFRYQFEIPANTTALICLPGKEPFTVSSGNWSF